jgi:putative ABC transport system permease protein
VVEIVERFAGEHDIAVTRAETSPSQTIEVGPVSDLIAAADPAVAAVYPRFHATVEIRRGGQTGNASLVARVPEDELGQITMLEGSYDLTGDQVVIQRVTADTFGLEVGDQIDLSYVLPVSRREGHRLPDDVSVNRVTRRFTVSGIALVTGLGGEGQNGVLTSVETVQEWLDLRGQAERLVVVLDEDVYASLNTQASIFRVRRIAERMVDALGSAAASYAFSLAKAQALDFSDVAFAVLRSISGVYGLLVMGVVGLLVYSIINTNVEERQRDLAFLRVLGAKRGHLFSLVVVEVALIGAVGVGLGIIAGQALSAWVVGPVANALIMQMGEVGAELGIEFQMSVTVTAMVRAASIAVVVLGLSAVAPARKAANTKVRQAINPGSADSLQIEDLARLRSRRFDGRIIVAGMVLTIMWGLIFTGTEFLFVQGNESIVSIFMFGGLVLLVIGVSLLFYALTIPFEYLLIFASHLVVPKITFLAAPNLLRAKRRNTLISLMIVFSATLPTFLGTMAALEQRNYDIEARFRNGAPITIELSGWRYGLFDQDSEDQLPPSFLGDLYAVLGVSRAVGLTAPYRADVTNKVELRSTPVQIQGLTDSLDGVVYDDLVEYGEGGPGAFERVLSEPDTIIVSQGYAEFMDLTVGDEVRVTGIGLDHEVPMRVVGLVDRMPGFEGFSRNENYVRRGESVGFVSLDTYIRLTHDPNTGSLCPGERCSPAERERPILAEILATTDGTEEARVVGALRGRLSGRSNLWIHSTAEDVRTTEQSMRTMRVLMLVMTALSFITSIFGVFAVVYVAVYVRRLEIGMLKAIGMRRRDLVRTFALESVMMTVSASLAGVTAGTVLGYVFYLTNNMMRDTPTQLTFDWMTTMAILVMVILASLISASLAARGVVRSKVTRILREAL